MFIVDRSEHCKIHILQIDLDIINTFNIREYTKPHTPRWTFDTFFVNIPKFIRIVVSVSGMQIASQVT